MSGFRCCCWCGWQRLLFAGGNARLLGRLASAAQLLSLPCALQREGAHSCAVLPAGVLRWCCRLPQRRAVCCRHRERRCFARCCCCCCRSCCWLHVRRVHAVGGVAFFAASCSEIAVQQGAVNTATDGAAEQGDTRGAQGRPCAHAVVVRCSSVGASAFAPQLLPRLRLRRAAAFARAWLVWLQSSTRTASMYPWLCILACTSCLRPLDANDGLLLPFSLQWYYQLGCHSTAQQRGPEPCSVMLCMRIPAIDGLLFPSRSHNSP